MSRLGQAALVLVLLSALAFAQGEEVHPLQNAGFEVITRVADDGERYLFAPSPDEARSDTVRMNFTAQAATDVSVQGGFPVPVRGDGDGAAIDMTFGPCESAVVWVI